MVVNQDGASTNAKDDLRTSLAQKITFKKKDNMKDYKQHNM